MSNGVCRNCRHHVDDMFTPCKCKEPELNENIIPGPGSEDAGTSEPINDAGGNDETQEALVAAQDALTATEPDEQPEAEAQVSIAVHFVLTTDGQFAIQATGEPNLGEMQMIASRGLASIEARIVAETIVQSQIQAAQEAKAAADQKRIITPRRG